MDEITRATVAAIRAKIANLHNAKLSQSYFYYSLPLCVIDAVFSIGVRYESVQNVIRTWHDEHGSNWPKYCDSDRINERGGMTITKFIEITNGYSGICLSNKFFGGNKQRTSTRSGILKADAVVYFAKALQSFGMEDFHDTRIPERVAMASQAVKSIPGQRSGLSFDYFMTLAGDGSYVKPDRMLCNFVADAARLPCVSPDVARDAVAAACRVLTAEFSNLTPRLLDHQIWAYQRNKD